VVGDGTVEFHGPRDYLDLAKSPEATPEQLTRLAQSPYPFVIEAVARHHSTPPEVLERLVPSEDRDSWNDTSLLLALAEHHAATPAVLAAVAQRVPDLLHKRDEHHGFAAGIALFRRRDTAEDVLLALLDDPRVPTEFRKVAARETARASVLDRLRQDRSERVRRAATQPRASEGGDRERPNYRSTGSCGVLP
jgi:hypothetical protein